MPYSSKPLRFRTSRVGSCPTGRGSRGEKCSPAPRAEAGHHARLVKDSLRRVLTRSVLAFGCAPRAACVASLTNLP